MEEQAPPTKERRSINPTWKLLAYFIGLFIFGKIVGLVFAQLAGSEGIQNFAKFGQIVQDSLDVARNRDDVITTVWSLLLACILVVPVGWVYSYTKAREGYDRGLVQTLIVMGMVVCGMMMLIQDQFSRALALVGVVSAVRFRTNLRDPKDAVYVLISIGIGMGAGLHVYRVASWMTIIMCATFLILSKYKVGERAGEEEFIAVDKKKDKKDKDKKDKKKEKKKDKNGNRVAVAASSLDRLERIADSIRDDAHGIRRPNAAVTLYAVDAEAAMGYVTNVLDRYKAGWHLVTFAPSEGETTLEYLIRVDGTSEDGDPLAAVARDMEGSLGTTIRTMEVRFVPEAGKSPAEA